MVNVVELSIWCAPHTFHIIFGCGLESIVCHRVIGVLMMTMVHEMKMPKSNKLLLVNSFISFVSSVSSRLPLLPSQPYQTKNQNVSRKNRAHPNTFLAGGVHRNACKALCSFKIAHTHFLSVSKSKEI